MTESQLLHFCHNPAGISVFFVLPSMVWMLGSRSNNIWPLFLIYMQNAKSNSLGRCLEFNPFPVSFKSSKTSRLAPNRKNHHSSESSCTIPPLPEIMTRTEPCPPDALDKAERNYGKIPYQPTAGAGNSFHRPLPLPQTSPNNTAIIASFV